MNLPAENHKESSMITCARKWACQNNISQNPCVLEVFTRSLTNNAFEFFSIRFIPSNQNSPRNDRRIAAPAH